jgi:peptidoglycan hydrolase FlgJ
MTSPNPVDFGASLNAIANAGNSQSQTALKVKGKAKEAALNFESMFLSNMFQEMMTKVDGDGPFGGSGPQKIWRSFMVDQMAKEFTKAGGIGLTPIIYREILKHQGLSA